MSSRTPSIVAVRQHQDEALRWVHSWRYWDVLEVGHLALWVEDLPVIDDGDEVLLTYFGPEVGDTANVDAIIATIERGTGGFWLVVCAGDEFVEELGDPSDEVEVIQA